MEPSKVKISIKPNKKYSKRNSPKNGGAPPFKKKANADIKELKQEATNEKKRTLR